MKIFYFSGTGNSLYIAKQIANEAGNSSIQFIPHFQKQHSIEIHEEKIGVIFPSYCQDIPDIVIDFCKKLKFNGNPYIFGIVTCNGVPGTSLQHLNNILRKKNQKLSAGWVLTMPGNSLHFIDYTNPREIQNSRHLETEYQLKGIIETIKRNGESKFEFKFALKNQIQRYVNYNFLFRFYRTYTKFYTDEKCNQCGICSKICPQENIKLTENTISWGKNCLQCLACLHWCPKESIQIKGKTEDKRRYSHPKIKLNEMIIHG